MGPGVKVVNSQGHPSDTARLDAEIIAIGTELLLGFVVNSDTAYLCRVLAGLGIPC